MADRLKGKVAFITGAGMGMGREASVLFAEEGARVVVADIDGKAAAETVAMIEKAGGQGLAVTGDVALEADVKRMVEEAVRRFGALHVLYNNAGVFYPEQDWLEVEPAQFDQTMSVNVRVPYFASQWVAKRLIAAGQAGSIVTTASIAGINGSTVVEYGASKAAVANMTKSLGRRLGKHNIRVNAVAPGLIKTAMGDRVPSARFRPPRLRTPSRSSR